MIPASCVCNTAPQYSESVDKQMSYAHERRAYLVHRPQQKACLVLNARVGSLLAQLEEPPLFCRGRHVIKQRLPTQRHLVTNRRENVTKCSPWTPARSFQQYRWPTTLRRISVERISVVRWYRGHECGHGCVGTSDQKSEGHERVLASSGIFKTWARAVYTDTLMAPFSAMFRFTMARSVLTVGENQSSQAGKST